MNSTGQCPSAPSRLWAFSAPSLPSSRLVVRRTLSPRCPRPQHKRVHNRNWHHVAATLNSTRPSPSSESGQDDVQSAAAIIPTTPCFTKRIMATPMDRATRLQYLDFVAAAFKSYLQSYLNNPSDVSRLSQLTLLLPELNPTLDVYDRRFLLQLTWALLRVTSSLELRACVLVQGARRFGAMPLSVAGLRRNFDADLELSRSEWPEKAVSSGELEDLKAIEEDVDIVLVLSPTNAVSIPTVDSVTNLVEHFKGKPIALINPRLEEIPSHSGVMQVQGRADRLRLLHSFEDIFYMRMLFDAGKNFPLRGILYKAHPNQWQAWYSPSYDEYVLAMENEEKPKFSAVSDAFRRAMYQIQKERISKRGDDAVIEQLVLSPPAVFVFMIIVGFVIFKGGGDNLPTLWQSLRDSFP
ncbi:Adenylate kinase/UMP-CMP kinase [Gracilaria domingensis]|nr:Adenylate kinase/UMP-CMP kinase [Gracilaria domingensis]